MHSRFVLHFDDNRALIALFGPGNAHLTQVEEALPVKLSTQGNQLIMHGLPTDLDICRNVFETLYVQAQKGEDVGPFDIDACLRFANKLPVESNVKNEENQPMETGISVSELTLDTRRISVKPRSPGQAQYLDAMSKSSMVFGLGPAGTGKTYLASAMAVSKLINGEVERIILTRPAVEAGERLGYLPGDMKEKIDPYLRPLYDAMSEMFKGNELQRKLENAVIEVAPLAFMRGRTLKRSFVILDEAQNTTATQMKMFLTRLGEGSCMVINGDMTQTDLPNGQSSGLGEAVRILKGVQGITIIEMDENDVVRHPLVARIVKAYDRASR